MSQLPSAKSELRGMSARICGNASSHRPPSFQYRVAARGVPSYPDAYVGVVPGRLAVSRAPGLPPWVC